MGQPPCAFASPSWADPRLPEPTLSRFPEAWHPRSGDPTAGVGLEARATGVRVSPLTWHTLATPQQTRSSKGICGGTSYRLGGRMSWSRVLPSRTSDRDGEVSWRCGLGSGIAAPRLACVRFSGAAFMPGTPLGGPPAWPGLRREAVYGVFRRTVRGESRSGSAGRLRCRGDRFTAGCRTTQASTKESHK
jgi:hypothetical protein